MKTLTAKQVTEEEGYFDTTVKMKGSEFSKLDSDIQCNLSGGAMWLDFSGWEKDETLIFNNGNVVFKSGRRIIGVQMTDETCSWYERIGDRYRCEHIEENHPNLNSVVDVVNYHYN